MKHALKMVARCSRRPPSKRPSRRHHARHCTISKTSLLVHHENEYSSRLHSTATPPTCKSDKVSYFSISTIPWAFLCSFAPFAPFSIHLYSYFKSSQARKVTFSAFSFPMACFIVNPRPDCPSFAAPDVLIRSQHFASNMQHCCSLWCLAYLDIHTGFCAPHLAFPQFPLSATHSQDGVPRLIYI